ncbi:MAG TPA: hypothetical protein VGP31_01780 [Planosporangium sp.]|nr:hypothetical protein [Planosporangium sp.]
MSGKSATPTVATKSRSRFHPVAVRLSRRLPTHQEAREALSELRMPGTPDPEVRLRRLLGVCAWAAALGFIGLIIGLRIVFGIFTHIPTWYLIVTFTLGVPGIAATVAAFATLHKGRLPWKLLGVATAAESISFAATVLL